MSHVRTLPQLPQVGLPEHEYRRFIEEAERYRDHHAREAFKVAKYITRAISKGSSWADREKCFKHALDHHCHAPSHTDEETRGFYASLAHMVREYAGAEVLRHVSAVDDGFAARLTQGEAQEVIAQEAAVFFRKLIPHHHKPDWLNLEDYEQVRVFEEQWTR